MKMKYVNVNAICAAGVLVVGIARVTHAQASGDRCTLLTPAVVSSAAGVTVGAGQPIATTGCSWQSDKPHVIVTVSFPGPSMNGVFTKENPTPGVTTTHPGGIGDDAVYITAGAMTTLYVKHAQAILMVRVYGIPDHDKQKSIEKTLALDVLKKL